MIQQGTKVQLPSEKGQPITRYHHGEVSSEGPLRVTNPKHDRGSETEERLQVLEDGQVKFSATSIPTWPLTTPMVPCPCRGPARTLREMVKSLLPPASTSPNRCAPSVSGSPNPVAPFWKKVTAQREWLAVHGSAGDWRHS